MTYAALFQNRGQSRTAHKKWLGESIELLDRHYTEANRDIDSAAKSLLNERLSVDELSALAYAGFCFWHSPIDHLIDWTKDPHWAANRALRSCIRNHPQEGADYSLEQTNKNLDLASVAFKARLMRSPTSDDIHEQLFAGVLNSLLANDKVANAAERWPKLLREDGTARSDMVTGGRLDPPVLQEILDLDPQSLAEAACSIFTRTARKILPDALRRFTDVPPNIFVASHIENPPMSGGRKNGSFNLDCEQAFVSSSAACFLDRVLHEKYHLIQDELMKNRATRSVYFCEALTYPPFSGKKRFDSPCRTYPISSTALSAEPAMRAYMLRPTEYYAHPFGLAIQTCLCINWDTPVANNIVHPDISRLMKVAANEKLVPLPPSGMWNVHPVGIHRL